MIWEVIGYQYFGNIKAIRDGMTLFVPDDMANSDRYSIWDTWEMGPPDPETGERVRINTIPPYNPGV
jgi:hypothetical protein